MKNNEMMEIDRELLNTFYSNVQCLIEREGCYIGEVEKAIGVSVGYFSRSRKHDTKIPLISAYKVSQYFGVSLEDLLTQNYREVLIEEKIKKLQCELDDIRGKDT